MREVTGSSSVESIFVSAQNSLFAINRCLQVPLKTGHASAPDPNLLFEVTGHAIANLRAEAQFSLSKPMTSQEPKLVFLCLL